MTSAGNRTGACSVPKGDRRDVSDTFPMIEDGEKVEKKGRNVGDVYKVGRSPSDGRQCPDRSPANSHRGFTDFSKIKQFHRLIGRF